MTAECWRIDAVKLWYWRRLESPLDSKEINQSIQPWIFIGSTDAKAEAPVLWPPDCEEQTHWKRSWCWERLRAGGEGGERMRWLIGIIISMDMSLSKLWEIVKDREALHAAFHGIAKNQTQHRDWTTISWKKVLVTQLCLILCNPMDCSLPGSSAHGIFQARILKWVAIPFSRGSSQARDWTQISCTADRFFAIQAITEATSIS